MSIRKLSALLVNQIAAGEVVERPASVVKELVENSLDAGAERITVRVEDGGRQLVRVTDDGAGIAPDQLALTVEPHATSKIESADDLAAIRTLGFRGEALASIASVGRVRITSRRAEDEAGATLEAEGDQRGEAQPAAARPGTTVEVRDLFHTTPARRKFLRTASTEFSHINDAVTRIALAHPEVGFTLSHNERTTFEAPPGQSARDRCLALLGSELADGLLEFESDQRGVGLWGMAGVPSLARQTSRHQYLYVNGRPVRDKNLAHAIREAYRGLIEPGQQPMLVLFVRLEPSAVDVNVHPTKHEVRFADGGKVHGQVLATVRQRLLGADLTPSVRPGGSQPSHEIRPDQLPLSAEPTGTNRTPETGGAPDGSQGAGAGTAVPSSVRSVGEFVDYFRRMDPKQKGFVYEQVRREMDEASNGDPVSDERQAEQPAQLAEPVRTHRQVLQVHDSYIVTQDEQGIVIIDQHALHERMMFETLQQRLRHQGALESQRLLTPAVIQADASEIDLLNRLEALLEKLGIEALASGPGSIAVQAFPTLLFDRGLEPGPFMRELLDKAQEDGFEPNDEQAIHEVLDMMSCKAAVKAGDRMSAAELEELINRREDIDRASNCPHGRPTTVRLSLSDLEKHFKRA